MNASKSQSRGRVQPRFCTISGVAIGVVVVRILVEEIRRIVGFDEMIRSDFVGHCSGVRGDLRRTPNGPRGYN